MPWKATCQMDERMQFIARVLAGEDEMTVLCREYGVSRKTGYKWLGRYIAEGAVGLAERSHAPLQHGQAHDVAVVQAVLGLRQRWPHWGPKKLRVKLVELHPELPVPAASTIGDWLRREGVAGRSRQRRRCPPYTQPFAAVSAANDVWCTDFKSLPLARTGGWFRTADGRRCDPFTLTDAHSRYLLRCQAVARPDEENVRPIFEAAFKEHGLPLAIRSDNGPPFASPGVGGLSRLAVWWIKLGIRPERIVAGKPQQNGRHERVHRTLKHEAATPPAASLPAQQQRCEAFRAVYNSERPHEALGQQTPASVYKPSPRPYPDRLEDPHYGDDVAVRHVRSNGQIKWAGERVFVGEALIGEPVGILRPRAVTGWYATPMSNWATSTRSGAGSVRVHCEG
jgi:putative transposase